MGYRCCREIPQGKNESYTIKFGTENAENQSQIIMNICSGIFSGCYKRYELQLSDMDGLHAAFDAPNADTAEKAAGAA